MRKGNLPPNTATFGFLSLDGGARTRDNGQMDSNDAPMPIERCPVRHITLHGEDVAYRRSGDGPVLLLLHGIAGSSGSWIPAMRLLRHEFTVLAPDFLGHGKSSKPLGDYSLGNQASGLRDFLVMLGIERVTVVGHSFGGGVAMQFTYQFPELCERLVLVDAGGLGREVSWLLRLATLPAAEYVMPALFPAFGRRWGDSVARFLGANGLRNARASEMWRSYRSLTETENRQAFVRTMRSVVDPTGQFVSATSRLYLGAHMPTLIVWGDHDRIIPVAHAFSAHEALPQSRLEVIEGTGHFPHVEEPSRFADIVLDFLHSTEPSTITTAELRNLLRGEPMSWTAGREGAPTASPSWGTSSCRSPADLPEGLPCIVFLVGVLLGVVAEIVSFVVVAKQIGFLYALVILVVASALGPFIVRRVGFAVLAHTQERLGRGEVPTRELLDGLVVLIGGVMICVPGFIGDAVGLLLMIGPVRHFVIKASGHRLARRVQRVRPDRWRVIDVRSRPAGDDSPPPSGPPERPLGPGPST
jgi:pimeloyl-ACP methyl ester carboxylesterase/UPF0716 family protein affecting phage T7 exclusion